MVSALRQEGNPGLTFGDVERVLAVRELSSLDIGRARGTSSTGKVGVAWGWIGWVFEVSVVIETTCVYCN